MRLFKQLLFGSCALLLMTMLIPSGKISAMVDERTVATFNAPFQVPGKVLPGGTYVFKLIEPMENRSIVRILNDNQTKVLATAVAIPTYRSDEEARRNDKPVFTFEERAEGSPHALSAWFYPGENYGHQFVYSPSELAPAATVPATPNEVPATTMNSSEERSNVAENNMEAKEEATLTTPPPETMPQPQATDQSTTPQPQTTPATEAKELPKTASSTPLIALMGTLSFGAAFGLWLLSKRIS
jgi:LPXTG-motif cell wall-anchored protein